MGRKSKNRVRSELVASETSLPLLSCGGLHVVVDLHEVGRLAAQGGSVIDDLDLQFLGCLVDDGHVSGWGLGLLAAPAEFAGDELHNIIKPFIFTDKVYKSGRIAAHKLAVGIEKQRCPAKSG